MTRARGELEPEEEALLGIERPSIEEEQETERKHTEALEFRRMYLTDLLRSTDFRAWLMERLVGFGTFEMPFGNSAAGFPDPHATFFALGMKAAGWALWEEFDALAPDLASMMRRGQ